jgi:hypothetical protein
MLLAVRIIQLVDVVWASALAGVGITTAYSLVVLGTARYAEAQRAGRSTAAALYAGIAALGLLAFAAGVAFGVHVMLAK